MKYFLYKNKYKEILVAAKNKELADIEVQTYLHLRKTDSYNIEDDFENFIEAEIGINYAIAYFALYNDKSYASYLELVKEVENTSTSVLTAVQIYDKKLKQ